jgi:hypothetical protein
VKKSLPQRRFGLPTAQIVTIWLNEPKARDGRTGSDAQKARQHNPERRF